MTFLRDKQFCQCFRPCKLTFIPFGQGLRELTVCMVFSLTKLFVPLKSHDNVGLFL